MDFSALSASLQTTLGAQLPYVLGALGILIIGWLAAVLVRAGTRRLLGMLKVNDRIAESTGEPVKVESGIATGAFWFVILVTLVAVLESLQLDVVSEPFALMISQFMGYLPRLVAGVVLLLLAWLLATLARALVSRALAATSLDEKLAAQAGMQPISRTAANVLFWLVILLFLPVVLAAFQLHGLLEPVQAMLARLLDMLPNVFAAALIGFVGWLVAKVLRGLVVNLLAAAGADGAAEKAGLDKSFRVSQLVGTIVFIVVFVPTLIAALDALRIEAISAPAVDMLGRFFAVVPDLIAAAAILVITWFVARFVANVITRLLAAMGMDGLPAKLGIRNAAVTGPYRPSAIAGSIFVFFAMLFAAVEAAGTLEFYEVRDMVATFIRFGGDILLGTVIFVIGYWLAGLAHDAIGRSSGEHSGALASVARIAILGLVFAMGLRAMGIADDIVNLAFGLTVGAVAVTVALAFGLGGRDAAGRQMEYWLARWRKDQRTGK